MKTITCFTDGASRGNPGLGSWAYLMYDEDKNVINQNCKGINYTTNNAMESTALLECLTRLINDFDSELSDLEVKIYTDSNYVYNTFNSWLPGWGFSNFENKRNAKIWQSILNLHYYLIRSNCKLHVYKCYGHMKDNREFVQIGNDAADKLCNKAMDLMN